MNIDMKGNGKDLTKEPPRSPRETIGGFAIIARTIDKCRALLWGDIGDYSFDCPLDKTLFDYKGITGNDFKDFVSTGASDADIGNWFRERGIQKRDEEINTWTKEVSRNNYSNESAEKKQWLSESATKLGLDKDATLFDYLDADDKHSFNK